MAIQPRVVVALFVTACSTPSANPGGDANPAGIDAPIDPNDPDAAPVRHTGGWRSGGHDPARAGRIEVAGPGVGASATLIRETVANGSFGEPVIDELGNLYLYAYTPGVGYELTSLAADGNVRWQVPVPATVLSPISLGPDGRLYALDAVTGSGDEPRLVVRDTASGATLDFSQALAGHRNFDVNLAIADDGAILLRSDTADDGYRLRVFDSIDQPRWSVPVGGNGASGFGGFARAPAGDVIVTPISLAAAGPFAIVALDAATGTERWRYPLDPSLLSPVVAIGADGATYVAASQMSGNLHVIRLSATGAFVWDHLEATHRKPFRILIGATTIVVGADEQGTFGGGVILTLAGTRQTGTFNTLQCHPQAIDPADVSYWACPYKMVSTTPTGDVIATWTRPNMDAFGSRFVVGPDGSLYDIFNPVNFPPKIIRVH